MRVQQHEGTAKSFEGLGAEASSRSLETHEFCELIRRKMVNLVVSQCHNID